MSIYYVIPVCRTIECTDHRQAQQEAKKLHPSGKAFPVVATGVYDDTVRTHTLDTYA